MQKKKRINVFSTRRVLAAILSIVMAVSYMPFNAVAADMVPLDSAAVEASGETPADTAGDAAVEGASEEAAAIGSSGDSAGAAPSDEAAPSDAPADDDQGDDAGEGGAAMPESENPEGGEEEGADEFQAESAPIEEVKEEELVGDITSGYSLTITSDDGNGGSTIEFGSQSIVCTFYDASDNIVQIGDNDSASAVLDPSEAPYTATESGAFPSTATYLNIWYNNNSYDVGIDTTQSYIKVNSGSGQGTTNDLLTEDGAVDGLFAGNLTVNLGDVNWMEVKLSLIPIDPASYLKTYVTLQTDTSVNKGPLSISWTYQDSAHNPIGEAGSFSIDPSQGTQSDSNSGDPYPAGTAYVNLKVTTIEGVIIDTTSNATDLCLDGDSIISEAVTKEAYVEGLLSQEGYTVSVTNAEDIYSLGVYVYFIPEPEVGKYKVAVTSDADFPNDIVPGIDLKFDTWENSSFYCEYTSMGYFLDLPYDGNTPPSSFDVSVDGAFLKYLTSATLTVKKSGQADNVIDIFPAIQAYDNRSHTYTYPSSGALDPEADYQLDVSFSYTTDLYWSYRDTDRNQPYYVDHCQVFLLDNGGNRIAISDYRNPSDTSGKFARYQLEVGQEYKLKIIPERGYQISSRNIGRWYYNEELGYDITDDYMEPSEEAGEAGIFVISKRDSDLYLGNLVRPAPTLADITAEDIGKLWVNGGEIGAFNPEAAQDCDQFDEDLGGSLMLSVADDAHVVEYTERTNYANTQEYDDAIKDKEIVAETTFSVAIKQAVAQDSLDGDYYPEMWIGENPAIVNSLKDPATYRFVYPGIDGAEYMVAAYYGGKVHIIDAAYEEGKFEFTTAGLGKFTILRAKNDKDDVIFDFTEVSEGVDIDGTEYTITPAASGGLIKIGDTKTYTYKGSGKIVLELKKKDGNDYRFLTEDEAWTYNQGWIERVSALFFCFKDDGEPWIFLNEVNDDGSFIIIPAVWGWEEHPYPIQSMLETALDHANDNEDKQARITVGADWCQDVAERQVELLGLDEVNYNFDFDGSNITKVTQEDSEGASKDYYFIGGEEYISFDVEPKEAGTVITNIRYRVIQSIRDPEHDPDKIINIIRSDFPGGRVNYDEVSGHYRVKVPVRPDWDWESVLGLQIIPSVQEMTTVTVDFGGSGYFNKADGEKGYRHRLYDVSVMAGNVSYEVTYDGASAHNVATANVPTGVTAIVKITSTDGYNAVSKVTYHDAGKNNGKELAATRNGVYSLVTTGKGSVSLEVKDVPVARLWITDLDGKEMEPVKGKYSFNQGLKFKAYLTNGSGYDAEAKKILPIIVAAEFKNGDKAITPGKDIEISDDKVLTTAGRDLGLAGKTLALKVINQALGITKTASIAFSGAVTAMTLEGADADNKLTIPYGASKKLKVTFSKGADLGNITARFMTSGSEYVISSFDGKTLTIDGAKVVKMLNPGADVDLRFFDKRQAYNNYTGKIETDNTVIKTFQVTFTDDVTGKGECKAPAVTENTKIATIQKIGLSLSLPRGVTAGPGLFYEVTATARIDESDIETRTINGKEVTINRGLSYFREENGVWQVVNVYERNITKLIPSEAKTFAMDVTDEPSGAEDGWMLEFDVTATLVYAYEQDGDYTRREIENMEAVGFIASTRGNIYETKLTLTKKAPAKIYTGQNGVLLAIPKWSANTTVKSLDRVDIINPYGNNIGNWSRWNNTAEYRDYDDYPMNRYIHVDEESGAIYLDTVQYYERYNEEEDRKYDAWDRLDPGKYTIVAYAVGGPGIFVTASMAVTVAQSIDSLQVSAPETVYKPAGKKASFKAGVTYSGWDDRTPATKKVQWSIIKGLEFDDKGVFIDEIPMEEDDPLYGKVSIKGGTVTVASDYYVSSFSGDNVFVVKAQAADYEGNTVIGYSYPVEIISYAQVPTNVLFRWGDERSGYNYSNITEENIKNGDVFFSSSINYAHPIVYDQTGREMEVTVKATGLLYNKEWGEFTVTKPGKATVTVTSTDGAKKSKKLAFKISYTGETYKLNVLIQDATAENDFFNPGSFINTEGNSSWDDMYTEGRTGNDDRGDIINNASGNSPIYVHVAGVRYADDIWYNEENEETVFNKWGEPDFHDSAQISHSIKVEGGKIIATRYSLFEHYVTYQILPTKDETKIKVTDNTVNSVVNRVKQTVEYRVINAGISTNKAYSISADKKNVYNTMDLDKTLAALEDVKNRVTYTVKNAPNTSAGKLLYARITMDHPDSWGKNNIAKVLGLQEEGMNVIGSYVPISAGKFSLNFFEDYDNRYHFDQTPVGSYNFYVTLGEATLFTEGENAGEVKEFTPLAAMTRMSIKLTAPPKATARFTNTKYTILNGDGAVLEIPSVANGYGVKTNRWPANEAKTEFDADTFYTMSLTTKGDANRFIDLFWVDNYADAEGSIISKPTDENRPKLMMGSVYTGIEVAKNLPWAEIFNAEDDEHNFHINCWQLLKKLKDGTYRVDENGHYTDDPNGVLLGTAKQQKAAYNKWIKENCTGYIGYRVVNYAGQETEMYQKITVDIDKFIDEAGRRD